MRLRFGTFANVLYLCGVRPLEKRALLNTICRSVDKTCDLSSAAVTALLQCTTELPDERSNGRGNVISMAADADAQKVAEYFSTKVITPLIDTSKRKLSVCAIRGIIMNDDTIDGDTVVEPINGITKNELRERSKFVLSEFLAGVFLFAAGMTNRVGKEHSNEITENFIESFKSEEKVITFTARKTGKSDKGAAVEAFGEYRAKAREKYDEIKTLLYFHEPKPFYDFYVPNHIEHGAGSVVPIKNVTVKTLTDISGFIVLSGVGGLGKSMMLRHLLLDAVKNFTELGRIPVFVPLKDFSATTGTLTDFIFSKVHEICSNVDKSAFLSMLRAGGCLLLLDGLDEVDDNRVGAFEREIEAFTDEYSKNCFVISSRPYQDFVSFSRFKLVKIMPFTKEQSVALIKKLEFRLDEPIIKEKFIQQLESKLSGTHKAFVENPLLLTIMLLMFDQFADIPDKMHIFFQRAFIVLSDSHDASKSGYKRRHKTGLLPSVLADYFAKFCFRTYTDSKFEFTKDEFTRYFDALNISVNADTRTNANASGSGSVNIGTSDKKVTAANFLYDICVNLCLMRKDGARYYFIHRSFQEYFCAVFFSKAPSPYLERLPLFLESRRKRALGDDMFNMLCDMARERVELEVFKPYLTGLFDRCERGDGYWTFLSEIYPRVTYELGDVSNYTTLFPSSYICGFILDTLKPEYTLHTSDLPEDEDFLVDEYVILRTSETETELLTIRELEREEYSWVQELPDIAGCSYEFNVGDICESPRRYPETISVLDDDEFVFKAEYNALLEYYEKLTAESEFAEDFFADLP